jgi:hypothetical protein
MAFLTRTDPTRNIKRFYIVDITPTLFGEWALVREGAAADPPAPCGSAATQCAMKPRPPRRERSSAGCSTVIEECG